MIKKIAIALASGQMVCEWDEISDKMQLEFLGMAVDVLSAMQEPTDDMWDAGADQHSESQDFISSYDAMIRAALEEE